MNNEKYRQYTLEDFLDDDAFIKWVSGKEQDVLSAQFWSEFPVQYPSAAANFNFAVSVIRTYRSQEVWENKDNKAHLLDRITATIAEESRRPGIIRRMNVWVRAAAIALLLTAGGYLLYSRLSKPHMELIATGYGEKRTITLPDHSVVTLNATSSVTFREQWDTVSPREVWIEGEAFFDVKHLNRDTANVRPGQRFLVHSHGLTIEVLGTSFNVRSRRGKTKVGLVTGKIQIGFNEGPAAAKAVVMLPGDYIEYADNHLLLTKKINRPESIKRWIQVPLTFTDATLGEIIETLQDNYGYAVRVSEQTIRKLKIEGDINVANVEELLTVITTTLNVRIEQPSEKELVITSGK
jgi:transmembrane sensor